MNSKEIQELAYKEVTEKLDVLHDRDKGTYFHGWFDCLYFVSTVLKEKK